jgi:hypothetical protein
LPPGALLPNRVLIRLTRPLTPAGPIAEPEAPMELKATVQLHNVSEPAD